MLAAGERLPLALDVTGVAVITGGASGFGLEVASRLVAGGMKVAILDISSTALDAAASSLAQIGANSDNVSHALAL